MEVRVKRRTGWTDPEQDKGNKKSVSDSLLTYRPEGKEASLDAAYGLCLPEAGSSMLPQEVAFLMEFPSLKGNTAAGGPTPAIFAIKIEKSIILYVFVLADIVTGSVSMKEKVIEFKNVSFRYDEEGPWVLKDCSFEIFENEWVAIIGHNGSGKSTIAKLLNGLLLPQEGEIHINGQRVTEESVWSIRKEVGMVFQNPDNQFVGATVQDDVAFGMENRGVPREEMIKRITETLQAVHMEDYRLTEPHRLSGGQKQRVAIAGVLAIYPKVLILDEATAMLDPHGRKEIMETVADIQKDKQLSLITITHDLQEVVQADRVIVMNAGEKWREAAPREIFQQKEELRKIGLDVPLVAILSDALKQAGLPISTEPMNHEELLEDLWTLHSKT